MNWLKRWLGHKVRSDSLLERSPTEAEIASACLYYDHSFGLMDAEQRRRLAWEAAEWLHSWRKVQEDCRSNTPYQARPEPSPACASSENA